jgi:hypothetical protein
MAFVVRATSTLQGWNINPVRQQAARILQLYRKELDEQLKTEIQKPQYAWPRRTKRRNGSIVSTPRNIVDTGAFLASQRSFQPDPLILRYEWGGNGGPVTYAGIILRGRSGTGRDGLPIYPARDWISLALAERPITRFFAANWNNQSSVPTAPRR